MKNDEVVRLLKIERECVGRDCDRDCLHCDLVQERDELIDAYDSAINILEAINEIPEVPIYHTCPKCGQTFIALEEPEDDWFGLATEMQYCTNCMKKVWNLIHEQNIDILERKQ